MSAIDSVQKSNPFTMKTGLRVLVGAVIGAALGFGGIKLALSLRVPVKTFPWSDLVALMLSVVFVGVALVTWIISFNRRELANNLECNGAAFPATNAEVSATRLQCITLFLAGLMLLLPVLAMGTLGSIPGGSTTIFAVIVLLFALQTVANVRIWRSSDEFLRRIMLISGAATFAIGQGALFLWAAAEHLHLAPPLSSWQAVVVMMTLYLATGAYISIWARR